MAEMSPAERLAKRRPRKRERRNESKFAPIVHCGVREIRESINLSLRESAEAIGLSISGMFAIEHGGNVTMEVALRISKFYGKPLDELWRQLTTKERRQGKQ